MPSHESEATEPTNENSGTPLSKRKRKESPLGPRMARAATLLRRKRLTKGKDDPKPPRDATWPLKKTGETMEIPDAIWHADHLRRLLEEDPALFQALHHLVEGRDKEVSKEQRRALRRDWLLVGRDYSPHPWVISTMKAALRQSADGPCIVDPLDVRTPEDEAFVRRVEDRENRIILRTIKKLRDGPDFKEKPDKGPSR
jgi:hypothetical protein